MQKTVLFLPFIFSLFFFSGNISLPDKERIMPTQDESFMMPIEDVFSISGRGTIVTGRIERGVIRIGDPVEIIGLSDSVIVSKIVSIELNSKSVTEANKADNVGILLRSIDQKQVSRGMMVCKPGSIKVYSEFKCQLSLLTKAEGGRSTPVFTKYRPQFTFYTALVSGEIILPEEKAQLQPGENELVSVKLSTPVAMETNIDFKIREGGRTVGSGKVTDLIK